MKKTSNPHSPVFEKIKRSLDPAFSYLIFEKAFSSVDKDVFHSIIQVIGQLNLGIFDAKIHHDKHLGLSLLVVRTDPNRADHIMQDLLNAGIPDDMTFFSYGSMI
ncbi:MAG: hypothetical protein LJE66_05070 [Desulfobacterales bacterium]|nr:hypothetical protein [Desulfobacterales bacterium]